MDGIGWCQLGIRGISSLEGPAKHFFVNTLKLFILSFAINQEPINHCTTYCFSLFYFYLPLTNWRDRKKKVFTLNKHIALSFPSFSSSYKGQLISKANWQAEDSPKKRTNEFVFTSMRRVFVRFLGESSALTICFRN